MASVSLISLLISVIAIGLLTEFTTGHPLVQKVSLDKRTFFTPSYFAQKTKSIIETNEKLKHLRKEMVKAEILYKLNFTDRPSPLNKRRDISSLSTESLMSLISAVNDDKAQFILPKSK